MKYEHLLLLLLLCAGCGGASTSDLFDDDDAGSPDASRVDAAKPDAGRKSDGGPLACGSTSCAPDEYCIHPCCGGARPPCVAVDDAGACPADTTNDPFSCPGDDPAEVCAPLPCTPDPPYCASTASCGGESDEPSLDDSHDLECVCE